MDNEKLAKELTEKEADSDSDEEEDEEAKAAKLKESAFAKLRKLKELGKVIKETKELDEQIE